MHRQFDAAECSFQAHDVRCLVAGLDTGARMLAEAGGSTPPDLSYCCLTADCAWHAGPKGLLTPQASVEDGDWSLPAREVGVNGGSRIRSALARSPTPANGGRAPPRRARRQLAFALLAAAAIWLLLTGIYMGSFIRTPVGAASASFRHLNIPVCSSACYACLKMSLQHKHLCTGICIARCCCKHGICAPTDASPRCGGGV